MLANVVMITAVLCCVHGPASGSSIAAHAETQALLTKWLATGNREDAEEHFALLARIMPLAQDDYRRFVEQVMYFVDHMEQREKVRASIVRSLLLLCRVPPGEIAAAASPYLYGGDEALRKEAWKLFISVLGSGLPEASVDLSHIRGHVAGNQQQDEIAKPLKRAIFEIAPNESFRLFIGEAERLEGIRLARAHRTLNNALFERNLVVHERGYLESAKRRGLPEGNLPLPAPWKPEEKSIEALRELATSNHWWARMFASEFMYHSKDFRLPDLIETLEKDENHLVRQSALSISTPDPLRATSGPIRP